MSRMADVIVLIGSSARTEDEIGNQGETPVEREVLGEEIVVYGTTFYNAAQAGIRPAKMFDLWRREYDGEDRLRHDGVIYRVVRTEARGEKVRLTCERVGADG